MWTRVCISTLLATCCCWAEIIDSIAATVNNQVITESNVVLELRLTAFLNGEPLDFSSAQRRNTVERLVEQALIRQEMTLGGYGAPDDEAAKQLLPQLKRDRFSDESQYHRELEKYGIRESELEEALVRQLATLRFIELRFRPAVQVSAQEIKEYYDNRLVNQRQEGGGTATPPLEQVRSQIEEVLMGERVDRLLDQWMKQARVGGRISLREKTSGE